MGDRGAGPVAARSRLTAPRAADFQAGVVPDHRSRNESHRAKHRPRPTMRRAPPVRAILCVRSVTHAPGATHGRHRCMMVFMRSSFSTRLSVARECGSSWERAWRNFDPWETRLYGRIGILLTRSSRSSRIAFRARSRPRPRTPRPRTRRRRAGPESVLVGRLCTANFSPSCVLMLAFSLATISLVELGRASAARHRDGLLEIVGALVVLIVDRRCGRTARLPGTLRRSRRAAAAAPRECAATKTGASGNAVELLDLGDVHEPSPCVRGGQRMHRAFARATPVPEERLGQGFGASGMCCTGQARPRQAVAVADPDHTASGPWRATARRSPPCRRPWPEHRPPWRYAAPP